VLHSVAILNTNISFDKIKGFLSRIFSEIVHLHAVFERMTVRAVEPPVVGYDTMM